MVLYQLCQLRLVFDQSSSVHPVSGGQPEHDIRRSSSIRTEILLSNIGLIIALNIAYWYLFIQYPKVTSWEMSVLQQQQLRGSILFSLLYLAYYERVLHDFSDTLIILQSSPLRIQDNAVLLQDHHFTTNLSPTSPVLLLALSPSPLSCASSCYLSVQFQNTLKSDVVYVAFMFVQSYSDSFQGIGHAMESLGNP